MGKSRLAGGLAFCFFIICVLLQPSNARADRSDQSDLSEMTGLRELAPRPEHSSRLCPEDPTQGEWEQAVGFYSQGSLLNASQFDLAGPGYVKIFRPRDRLYATSDLIAVIESAAIKVQAAFPHFSDRLQIGDVAARAGGTLGGHASHQNGLDADVAFLRVNHTEQNPDLTTGFQETFVRNGKVSGNFDIERNWAFVQALVDT